MCNIHQFRDYNFLDTVSDTKTLGTDMGRESRNQARAVPRGAEPSCSSSCLGKYFRDEESSDEDLEKWVAQADGSFTMVYAPDFELDTPALKRVRLDIDQLELSASRTPPLDKEVRFAPPGNATSQATQATSAAATDTPAYDAWAGDLFSCRNTDASNMEVDMLGVDRARGSGCNGAFEPHDEEARRREEARRKWEAGCEEDRWTWDAGSLAHNATHAAPT